MLTFCTILACLSVELCYQLARMDVRHVYGDSAATATCGIPVGSLMINSVAIRCAPCTLAVCRRVAYTSAVLATARRMIRILAEGNDKVLTLRERRQRSIGATAGVR